MPAPQAENSKFLEEFGAKFAAIFRSRHGRGPACLSFIGWVGIRFWHLNSIPFSAKMLGHQGLKKDHKLLDTMESLSFWRSVYR